ncbi:hypothetical protein ACQKO7_06965 [Pseudomonas putida]|uniref:hypothetical protein n=1 Tax=Pseudomonas TaxID=286 RepID=UPI000CE5ECBC|nr:hypothetical protein [Pseudomonas sp. SWI44]AVD90412.1 hypothetical protein C4Q26_26145 [Pseudomonas sp. SWI44]
MDLVVPRNRSLEDLLSNASSADLDVLADLITDNGKGRVALDSKVKATILNRKAQGKLQSIPDVLEAEIRSFGSNSIATFFRSSGVAYMELATDVAKKLDGKPGSSHDIYAVEEMIIGLAVKKYIGDVAAVEYRDIAKLSAYIAQIVKGLISAAGAIGGIAATGGAAGVAGAVGGRLLSLAAPPLALGAAGAAIYQATSPAFRITTPAVLQVAKIRRARYEADFATYSEKLRACL